MTEKKEKEKRPVGRPAKAKPEVKEVKAPVKKVVKAEPKAKQTEAKKVVKPVAKTSSKPAKKVVTNKEMVGQMKDVISKTFR